MERLEELRLIKKAKQGDVDAYGRLYEMVYLDLYRFALFTLKNPHDAEDVVSDTVTDSFVGIRKLKADEAFRGWIFKILTNKCRRMLKQRVECPAMKEYQEAMSGEEGKTGGISSSGEEANREDLMDLYQAFGSLPEEDRLIISLSFFGGYTSEEIARILKRKSGTIRSRQSRALARMRELLNGTYGL
ncbi:MAG: sigma-70 family RNA polymerase sigma factor [Lachnospiraceae bacterium]|nr:sigma-70 family RNA polymerase sigma factor [Lachnospiraceae bacterium]